MSTSEYSVLKLNGERQIVQASRKPSQSIIIITSLEKMISHTRFQK